MVHWMIFSGGMVNYPMLTIEGEVTPATEREI
jgi:hypothetical protein